MIFAAIKAIEVGISPVHENNFPSSHYKEQHLAVAKHLLAIWKTRQTSEKTDLH